MFCVQCGTSLVDSARFCSTCGTPVAGAAGAVPTPASPPISPIYQQPVYQSPPISPSSALLGPSGYPQPAFERLASAVFRALDQTIQPRGTGGLEVAKMVAYRTMGGATVPPFYGEHVLPTYASVVGIDLIPNQPRNAPVISWNGWRQLLIQKIMCEPDATFLLLSRLLPALGIPIALTRADFPAMSDPGAVAKEARFKAQIYGMARRGMAMGAIGGGLGGGLGMLNTGGMGTGMGMGGGGGSHSGATGEVVKLMAQGGLSFLNNGGMGGAGA